MQKSVSLFVAALLFLGVVSCTNTTDSGSAQSKPIPELKLKPAIKGLDVPKQTFTVNAETGGAVKYATGSEITIPANAVVDANGEPVKGDFQLSYREFHKPEDILLSGINMGIEKDGKQGWLETGGMFEIAANQNGNPLFVKEGQKINVNLASYSKDDDYNFYTFNPETNKWDEKAGPKASTPNPEFVSENIEVKQDAKLDFDAKSTADVTIAENSTKPVAPLKPISEPKNKSEIFKFGLDYAEFPELASFKDVRWTMDKAVDVPEKVKGKSKAETMDWVLSQIWSDIQLKATDTKGVYRLELSDVNSKAAIEVRPVLKAEEYAKAQAEFEKKMDSYKTEFAKIDEKKRADSRRAEVVAAVFRQTEISSFGLHNYDRLLKEAQSMALMASFEFNGKNDVATVYMISKTINSVITYNVGENGQLTYGEFRLLSDESAKMFAILPNNKLAVLPKGKMKGLIQKARNRSKDNEKINFEVIDKELTSLDDAKAFLELN